MRVSETTNKICFLHVSITVTIFGCFPWDTVLHALKNNRIVFLVALQVDSHQAVRNYLKRNSLLYEAAFVEKLFLVVQSQNPTEKNYS